MALLRNFPVFFLENNPAIVDMIMVKIIANSAVYLTNPIF